MGEYLVATTDESIEVGKFRWYYREALPLNPSDRAPVVLLHGLVSQSYGWRDVLPALADQGFRAIAPDWLGCGYSDMPDRRDFAYTPDAFVEAFGHFLDALELPQVSLVVQGFLAPIGLLYALRHPDRVNRVAILNAPLATTAKLPWKLQQMGIPLVGDMLTQDPLLVDRTLEGGGGYRIADKDLDVYRRPWLKTSDAGRSLLRMIQNLQLAQTTAAIASGFRDWPQPVLVGWGLRDPWLPLEMAEAFVQSLPAGELVKFEEVGHYPQEDWHEKVNEILLPFLRRQAI
jgi:pimeloyl-ACP methyl ester carboxylesterase